MRIWPNRVNDSLMGSSLACLALCAALSVAACDGSVAGIAPNVASLRVSPSDTTILLGNSVRLVAVAVDRNDNVVSPQPAIVFDVDKPAIATVDATGLLTTKTGGTVTITARLAGANDDRVARATVAIGFDVLGLR